MADPITLGVVGATAGAMLNRNDPVKGALMGGALGYGGGAMFGANAAGAAAAPVTNATYAASAPEIAGLTAQTAEQAAAASLSGPQIGGFGSFIGPAGAVPGGGVPPLSGPVATETGGLLGGTRGQQLLVANQLLSRNQQAQQRLPMAPAIQSRPFTGMKNPVMSEEERIKQMMAMYSMPQRQPIRLI